MLWRACCFVLGIFVATSALAQTIYFKRDHIYNGPGGKEIAVVPPAPSDQAAPTAPASLSASNVTAASVQLNWNASSDSGGSGLAGYKVYRQQGTGANLPVGTITGLSFTDQPLLPSTSYTYTIIAFDAAQNHSTASNAVALTTSSASSDATAPGAPVNVRGSVVNRTTVRLQWDRSTDAGGSGLSGYKVYRGGNLISGANPISNPTYDDSGLAYNTAYSYTVKAIDGNNNSSGDSSAVNVTTARQLVFQDIFDLAEDSSLNSTNWQYYGTTKYWKIRQGTADALLANGPGWFNACGAADESNFRATVDVRTSQSSGVLFWFNTGGSATYRALRNGSYLELYYDSNYNDSLFGSMLAQASIGSCSLKCTLTVEGTSASRNIKAYVDGVLKIDFTETDTSRPNAGRIGITAYVPSGGPSDTYLDNWMLER